MNRSVDTKALIRKGLRELADHRADTALDSFRRAVDAIPPSCGDELSRALYWLSVALLRLDQRQLALKSLASAQKLRRRGHARLVYLRNANEYGMPRQPTPELDDFHAFMNIQMASYLSRKTRNRFDSFAEHDAVMNILLDSWKRLRESRPFSEADCGEKLVLFRRFKPAFPDFGLSLRSPRVLRPDFGRPRSSDPSARCPCGSGLPFSQCCGRVNGLSELDH